MYRILHSKKFKKRARKIVHSGTCPSEKIAGLIDLLSSGVSLPPSFNNHKLQGKYIGMYECHVRPDLLLIYEKDEESKTIVLEDLGSHSELFK